MMCSPLDEGGLDIPLASLINDAASLKLYWNFVFSNEIWEQFLRVRLLPNSCQVSSYKKSSLWSSFKHHIGLVMDNSIWLLGSSYNTNFWNDSWCLDRSISDVLNLPTSIRRLLSSSVTRFHVVNGWNIPQILFQKIPQLEFELINLSVSLNQIDEPI